ncbi:hypothetical protein ABO04_09530 [Nitrosomonas sp. HPC101]|uniref:DUF5658 family protein n=1 Tax=Nitrosomonas sp. HPC101 TaxID=1658667 RepID=UPI0013699BBF|nr:DUF5658 family protein [Nitrosomonas sp. HPC101]MXS86132.1 hypothetical protein [Nitrosomonas sp. HPC101]
MANQLVIDQRLWERRAEISFSCPYQLGLRQGRRIAQRRSDHGAAYVDQYGWHLVACVLGIVLLSAADAFLTINILSDGGTELNYFMAALIEESMQKFVCAKLALTALAAIILTIHHEMRLYAGFRCRHLLYLFLSGYACLISYELMLLQLMHV